MRPALLATSVPLPMAMPMSAALIAGASLTPSPVMATTSPFLLQRLDEQHLVLGRHAADDADVVDARAGAPCSLQRGELRPQHRLAGDAELLGDRGAGGDVVAGHRHADVGLLRVAYHHLDSSRGGSTMPTIDVSCRSVT